MSILFVLFINAAGHINMERKQTSVDVCYLSTKDFQIQITGSANLA